MAVLARENLRQAWKRVEANKGAVGVDGLDIDQTARHFVTTWPTIRDLLLRGTYRPSPVRRVTIPKPDAGERKLGIPTVTDRLIQQALLQVLQPILDPTFSEHSYGFRPGRRAHDAAHMATPPTAGNPTQTLAARQHDLPGTDRPGRRLAYRKRVAQNSRCWWRNRDGDIKRVLTIAYFDKLGVPRLS
jgi:hypothetical protein